MESDKSFSGDIMEPTPDTDVYPRWSDACIWKSDGESLIIVRISEEHTEEGAAPFHAVRRITLNREGRDTWLLCTGERTAESIIRIVQGDYQGDLQLIQRDVLDMLRKLADEGFLVLESALHPATRSLDGNVYPRRSDDAIANTVENSFIIMNMLTSEAHSFEKSVEHLWNLCDGAHTVNDILSFAADADEVLFMLHFLVRLGLIELKS